MGSLDNGFFASAHDLIGAAPDSDHGSGRVWARTVNGGNVIDIASTPSDPNSTPSDARVRVGFDGMQLGAEIQVAHLHLGVTGGYAQTSARDDRARTSIRAPFYGLYGVYNGHGVLFDMQARHDDLTIRPDAFLAGAIKLNGEADTFSASVALPRRAGIYTVEPFASYSHSKVAADPLTLGGGVGVLNFSGLSDTTQAIGIRIATEVVRGDNRIFPFVSLSEVRDAGDKAMTTFVPVGGAGDVTAASSRMGTFTQLSSGLTLRPGQADCEIYVRGDARIGESINGYAVSGGLRLRF